LQETDLFENEKVLSIEEELNLILKNAEAPLLESEDLRKLKQEFFFLNTGKRTSNLEKLYNALCTVKLILLLIMKESFDYLQIFALA
jgi:hypothetical protein